MKSANKQIFILFLFSVLFIQKHSTGQITTTEGSLLRINFFQDKFDSSDRICLWKDYYSSSGHSSSEYTEAFQFNNSQYFTASSVSDSWVLPGGDFWVENRTTNSKQRLLSYFGVLDIIDPYMFKRIKLMKEEAGWWLVNGELGIGFINSQDSLLMEPEITDSSLMHICGKIDDKFLVVLRNYSVGFTDLSNFPIINSVKKIYVEDNLYPQQVKHIRDSLYFMQSYYDLSLAIINDKHIQKEGVILEGYGGYRNDWCSVNEKIYFVKMEEVGTRTIFNLVRSEIDITEKKLVNETELVHDIEFNYDFSNNGNYFTCLSHNSLIVYSLAEEKTLNSYDLSAINYVGVKPVFIDSPYVYVHVADRTVDVANEDKIPEQFSLSQNYPNPFNPSTTIEYTIHTPTFGVPSQEGNQRGVFVALKIYDLLGREIATLVDEYQQPGSYSVQFNVETRRSAGKSLPSGVYFYTLRVSDFSSLRFSEYQETKKMLLIK